MQQSGESPKLVLLVDDDELLLEAFKTHLTPRYSVDVATSGEQAAELVAAKDYPVVISDMHMDTMTGIEFIVSAREKLPKSIYMLLTASREKDVAVSALNDAGVYCIINKPCSMSDLDNFVEAAFSEYEKKSEA